MDKDFNTWNTRKTTLNSKGIAPYFHTREIWWCSIGINIGSEIDGKNNNFERPVLILRTFNREMFWGIPLTSKNKNGKYYVQIKLSDNDSMVMLSQLRLLSSNRLLRKIGTLDRIQFNELKSLIVVLLK